MEEDWLKLKEKVHERRELLERDKSRTHGRIAEDARVHERISLGVQALWGMFAFVLL